MAAYKPHWQKCLNLTFMETLAVPYSEFVFYQQTVQLTREKDDLFYERKGT